MKNPLIINARHQLRWHQRFVSDASTLLLWSVWLWLCRPVVFPWHAGAMVSLEGAMLALVGTGALLMIWNRLASQPAVRPRLQAKPDFASHFALDARLISDARDSAVCVVHHDEQGRIVSIESKSVRASSDDASCTLARAA